MNTVKERVFVDLVDQPVRAKFLHLILKQELLSKLKLLMEEINTV